MIGTEDIRRALDLDEVDENQFFETKEELDTLIATLASKLYEPDFKRHRTEIMEEITHIVSSVDVRFVPFLMLLLQTELVAAFQMTGDIISEEF